MAVKARAVPGYPPPAKPEPIADLPHEVVEAWDAYTFAKSKEERAAAVRDLSAFERKLPPGQQAYFRVKSLTPLATPYIVKLQRELEKAPPPNVDPFEAAQMMIIGTYEHISKELLGRSGEWHARAVPIQKTFGTLRSICVKNLKLLRERAGSP